MASLSRCLFSWDDYTPAKRGDRWAHSARGWVDLVNHPDRPDGEYESRFCGNYLDYSRCSARGPNGETVHAVAYIVRYDGPGRLMRDIRLGWTWCRTMDEAKAFIEGNIRAYFGLPRDGRPVVGKEPSPGFWATQANAASGQ